MKRTLANIKKLIEAKIIQYRKLQDEQQSAGNYERAEKYKNNKHTRYLVLYACFGCY